MTRAGMDPLTREQVEELPQGTAIEVIWSGGNGPHRYTVHVDENEQRYAATGNPRMDTYNPLDFVGQEPYHTRVWLAASPDPDPEP